MTFETEYQLEEFRKVQDEYFDERGILYPSLIGTSMAGIMGRMLQLINRMELEIHESNEKA